MGIEKKMAKQFGKSTARGFSNFVKALDEINENARILREEREALEKELRAECMTAILKYEEETGVGFQRDDQPDEERKSEPVEESDYSAIKILPYSAWDLDRKGHLLNCRSSCMYTHCLTCGTRTFGSDVYCAPHDPS